MASPTTPCPCTAPECCSLDLALRGWCPLLASKHYTRLQRVFPEDVLLSVQTGPTLALFRAFLRKSLQGNIAAGQFTGVRCSQPWDELFRVIILRPCYRFPKIPAFWRDSIYGNIMGTLLAMLWEHFTFFNIEFSSQFFCGLFFSGRWCLFLFLECVLQKNHFILWRTAYRHVHVKYTKVSYSSVVAT